MLTVYQGISTGYPEQCTIAQQEADSYASPPVPKRVRDIAGDEEPTRKRFRVRWIILHYTSGIDVFLITRVTPYR